MVGDQQVQASDGLRRGEQNVNRVDINSYVQGSAEKWSLGCVNAAGKANSNEQQREQPECENLYVDCIK